MFYYSYYIDGSTFCHDHNDDWCSQVAWIYPAFPSAILRPSEIRTFRKFLHCWNECEFNVQFRGILSCQFSKTMDPFDKKKLLENDCKFYKKNYSKLKKEMCDLVRYSLYFPLFSWKIFLSIPQRIEFRGKTEKIVEHRTH